MKVLLFLITTLLSIIISMIMGYYGLMLMAGGLSDQPSRSYWGANLLAMLIGAAASAYLIWYSWKLVQLETSFSWAIPLLVIPIMAFSTYLAYKIGIGY